MAHPDIRMIPLPAKKKKDQMLVVPEYVNFGTCRVVRRSIG